ERGERVDGPDEALLQRIRRAPIVPEERRALQAEHSDVVHAFTSPAPDEGVLGELRRRRDGESRRQLFDLARLGGLPHWKGARRRGLLLLGGELLHGLDRRAELLER